MDMGFHFLCSIILWGFFLRGKFAIPGLCILGSKNPGICILGLKDPGTTEKCTGFFFLTGCLRLTKVCAVSLSSTNQARKALPLINLFYLLGICGDILIALNVAR